MLMRCECEQCGTPLLVDSERAGSVLRCVECWAETTVVEADTGEGRLVNEASRVISSWPADVVRPRKSLLPYMLPVLAVVFTAHLVASDFWGLLDPGERPRRAVALQPAPVEPEPPAAVVFGEERPSQSLITESQPQSLRTVAPPQPFDFELARLRSNGGPGVLNVSSFANSEEGVLKELGAAPEVGLTRDAESWLAHAPPTDVEDGRHALERLLAKSDELGDLPFQFGDACLSENKRADDLERCAGLIRPLLQSQSSQALDPFLADRNFLDPVWLPAFAQMLPAEPMIWRLALVDRLSNMPPVAAGRLLAERAVFDPSHLVRAAALRALRDRPVDEYGDVLLKAFRHPWPTAARHAATAVAELKLASLEGQLRPLLELPDPAAPIRRVVGGREQFAVPTLVRVNHLKNCLACHQRSVSREGRIVASAPSWDRPLNAYYGDRNSSAFVRADVVYLRQDFSVRLPVPQPSSGWPREQRFDFFVSLRPVSDAEARDIVAAQRPDYPQRISVQTALEALAWR